MPVITCCTLSVQSGSCIKVWLSNRNGYLSFIKSAHLEYSAQLQKDKKCKSLSPVAVIAMHKNVDCQCRVLTPSSCEIWSQTHRLYHLKIAPPTFCCRLKLGWDRLERNIQLWCSVACYWQGLLEIGFLTSTCDLETWSTWQSNHPFQYETTPLCSGHILKSVLQRWNLSMLSLPATV